MATLKDKIKDTLYGALGTVTRKGIEREVGGFKVRFPVRYARYYEANYEPVTFDFLRRHCKPGSVFFDCGAHIGLFAVVGAKLVGETGKVFSFEPTPQTRRVLEEVIKINNCGNIVEVREEAISNETGTATFFETGEDISNANSLVQTRRHGEGLTVPTVSLDDFVSERGIKIDVIKIDVEGAELNVLRGAFQTLKNQRPLISLGLHPQQMNVIGATLEEVWEILTQLNLEVLYEDKKIAKDWFVAQEYIFDVQCFAQK